MAIFCPYFWIFHFFVSVTKQATRPLVMVGRIVMKPAPVKSLKQRSSWSIL